MQEIKLDSVVKRFEDHLKIKDNYRIILSGKFGIGKTFFLREFFNSKKKEYNPIFINPVNYVISPNEDIFELIKVDIIKQLYTTELTKKNTSVSTAEKVALFASEKPQHFLKFITSSFKKINPLVEIADELYDGLAKLYSEYKDYEKTLVEKFKVSEERIEEFTASFNNKTGSIFEEDFITKTIREKLLEVKGKKKNVLIIDDLDRIDPEHVFRILNILSAHNNSIGSKNKFQFDYIIVVCDNDNIKNIFYHKYGKDVDFDGYMDKFYSTEIFKYENDEALKFYLKTNFVRENDSSGFIDFTLFILNSLIDNGKLTIRKVIKHLYDIKPNSFIIHEQKGLQEQRLELSYRIPFILNFDYLFVNSEDLQILRFFKLMSIIYGDFNSFYEDLEDLVKIKKVEYEDNLGHLLSFLVLQKHISSNIGDELFFRLSYGKNYRDETVLSEINVPKMTFLSKDYYLKLAWDGSNRYDGSTSYFNNSQALEVGKHHHNMNRKQVREIELSQVFKTVKEIILECHSKNYLYHVGIILKRSLT